MDQLEQSLSMQLQMLNLVFAVIMFLKGIKNH